MQPGGRYKLISYRGIAVLLTVVGCVALSKCALATVVRFNTTAGSVDVRLFDAIAPNSVANFLGYVTSDRYVDTFIHRVPQRFDPVLGYVSADFVVQGGGFKLNANIFEASGIVTDDPIGDEFGLSNIRGSLSFAKNSLGATSQWFFNIGDNSGLDAQDFTVFGRVLGDGMQVIDLINSLDTINASVAENQIGEDFDEIPVFDLDKAVTQNNVFPEDVVSITSVTILDNLPGDYNFDGVVNLADYTLWRDTLGSDTQVLADGNGDGVVNQADYDVWKENFGAVSGSLSALSVPTAVPEPATAMLLLAEVLALACRAKKAGLE